MKITFLRFIIILFGIFAISRVFLRFRGKEISLTGTIFWIITWVILLTGAIFPEISSKMAITVGIGRGVDTAFLISIFILFYLIFRLYIK